MKHLFLYFALILQLSISAKQEKLMFIENQGQWNSKIFFSSLSNEADVLLMEDGFVINLKDLSNLPHHPSNEEALEQGVPSYAYKMKFINHNAVVPIIEERCETVINFFIGKNEERWRTGISSAYKIRYPNFYQNIDLLVYSYKGRFKYDFILHPNANPKLIQWTYESAYGNIDEEGQLNIEAGRFHVQEGLPFTYQRERSIITEIHCSYSQFKGVYSFELGNYNPAIKTTIDPEIVWSSYSDVGRLNLYSAVNDQNQTLFGARTLYSSLILETTLLGPNPELTSYIWPINCLSENGETLIWLTFIAGTDGGGFSSNLKLIDGGNIAIIGSNSSTDFPYPQESISSEPGLGILTLNPSGNQIISGSSMAFLESQNVFSRIIQFGGLDIESQYNVSIFQEDEQFIVTFRINGVPGFTPTNSYGELNTQSIVIASFDLMFTTLNWTTCFGPETFECNCALTGFGGCRMHLLSSRQLNNSVLLTGHTWCPMATVSENAFDPTFSGDSDGFMLLFSLDTGLLEYASYFGGDEYDQIIECLVVDDGVWIAGTSSSLEIDANYTFGNEAIFYAKMDLELQNVEHFFKIGQPQNQVSNLDNYLKPNCLQVDDCGNLISGLEIIHNTTLPNGADISGLPLINPVQENGATYYFYYSLATESIQQATYLGGGSLHTTEDVTLVNGDLRLAMCAHIAPTEFTSSVSHMPTTPNAYASFNEEDLNGAETSITNLHFDLPSGLVQAQAEVELLSTSCTENIFSFTSQSNAPWYAWEFGNGDSLFTTETNIEYIFDAPGSYTVSHSAIDSSTCNVIDVTSFEINIDSTFSDLTFDWVTPAQLEPCSYPQELVFNYMGSGEDLLIWSLPNGEEVNNFSSISYSIEEPGNYLFSIEAIDQACDTSVAQTISLDFYPSLSLETSIQIHQSEQLCEPPSVELDVQATGYELFEWTWNNEVISEQQNFWYEFNPGNQNIQLYVESPQCEEDSTVIFELNIPELQSRHDLFIPNVFTPNQLGLNEHFRILFEDDFEVIRNFDFRITNRWGKEIFTSQEPSFHWNGIDQRTGNTASEGSYFYTLRYQLECSEEVFKQAGEFSLLR